MRGCFRSRARQKTSRNAFPAYAGMFPPPPISSILFPGFPRVCGDVSHEHTLTNPQAMLSPRMRGCFFLPIIPNQAVWAFPAYAGMFPSPETGTLPPRGFPRVCGDVSVSLFLKSVFQTLSPRMRGCFPHFLKSFLTALAFPAYAGMFPAITRSTGGLSCFPRVCGDVSETIISINITHVLSPRMRGCFYQPAQ